MFRLASNYEESVLTMLHFSPFRLCKSAPERQSPYVWISSRVAGRIRRVGSISCFRVPPSVFFFQRLLPQPWFSRDTQKAAGLTVPESIAHCHTQADQLEQSCVCDLPQVIVPRNHTTAKPQTYTACAKPSGYWAVNNLQRRQEQFINTSFRTHLNGPRFFLNNIHVSSNKPQHLTQQSLHAWGTCILWNEPAG